MPQRIAKGCSLSEEVTVTLRLTRTPSGYELSCDEIGTMDSLDTPDADTELHDWLDTALSDGISDLRDAILKRP